MEDDGITKSRMSWRRGFHRVFLLLWVLWALFVLIGVPILQARQASDFAVAMYSITLNNPAKDDSERAARVERQNEYFAQASLSHIYKTQVLPNFHWFVLAILIPPVVLYALVRGGILLVSWLYRGFTAP
jgi:hypothetical protein